MQRYLIILFCLILTCLNSPAADETNDFPIYATNFVAEPFYGKFKSKLLKLTKFSPGTNSINSFVVSESPRPFKIKALRDLNNDGNLDLLTQTGRVILISFGPDFNSSNVTTLSVPLPNPGFKLVCTADINGDGASDIILQKGKKVTAYLANEGTFQQTQLKFGNALAPKSKVLGALYQNTSFTETQTTDPIINGTILNTVAAPNSIPVLIVKVGRELFAYTNSNGFFFPTELPLYTLQPKEKFVGTFKTGLSPQVAANSVKTKATIDESTNVVDQTTVILSAVGGLDIVIQRRREVLALSTMNNFATIFLVASNAAGVKVIGPR